MAVSTAERLGQKEILIRGKGGQHGTAVALLTLFEDGACVINSWGTFLPGETTLSLADRWKGTGLWILLFCLELKREGTPNETRWILLATDGARAWLPLRGGPQIVLPRVSLRPQGQSLYLDAGPEGGPDAVFVLRDDSFEKLK